MKRRPESYDIDPYNNHIAAQEQEQEQPAAREARQIKQPRSLKNRITREATHTASPLNTESEKKTAVRELYALNKSFVSKLADILSTDPTSDLHCMFAQYDTFYQTLLREPSAKVSEDTAMTSIETSVENTKATKMSFAFGQPPASFTTTPAFSSKPASPPKSTQKPSPFANTLVPAQQLPSVALVDKPASVTSFGKISAPDTPAKAAPITAFALKPFSLPTTTIPPKSSEITPSAQVESDVPSFTFAGASSGFALKPSTDTAPAPAFTLTPKTPTEPLASSTGFRVTTPSDSSSTFPPATGFSFGGQAAKSPTNDIANSGQIAPPKATFSFEAPAAATNSAVDDKAMPKAAFSFGAPPDYAESPVPKPAFSFGAPAAHINDKEVPKAAFSFGAPAAATTGEIAPPTAAFSFGASAGVTDEKAVPKATFSFGAPAATTGETALPKATFSFGAPATTPFSFSPSATPTTTPSFGVAPPATSSGFTFGASAPVINAATAAPAATEEEGDSMPAEAQVGDSLMSGKGEEDETTIFQKRAKIYSDPHKTGLEPVGLGELKLNMHKTTKKLRLLCRADGMGTVLMNCRVSGKMPLDRPSPQRLRMVLPDADGKPLTWLIHMKMPADVDALEKLLNA